MPTPEEEFVNRINATIYETLGITSATWFASSCIKPGPGGKLTIELANSFIQNWVTERYLDQLVTALSPLGINAIEPVINEKVGPNQYFVEKGYVPIDTEETPSKQSPQPKLYDGNGREIKRRIRDMESRLNPEFTDARFIVSDTNRIANTLVGAFHGNAARRKTLYLWGARDREKAT
jgi:chromosomal replication initiation ATPase DnaA